MSLPGDFADRLRGHNPLEPAEPLPRRSAVAAVLRNVHESAEVLLMTRVEHEHDPWSGQVSLPGGHREPADADLLATAIRETREEVGLDLTGDAELICRLEAVRARARGRLFDMDVTPFVFQVEGEADPAPGPEARDVFWFPLAHAASGAIDSEHRYERDGLVRRMPSWRFDGRVVWGLTYIMLRGLLEASGALPPRARSEPKDGRIPRP